MQTRNGKVLRIEAQDARSPDTGWARASALAVVAVATLLCVVGTTRAADEPDHAHVLLETQLGAIEMTVDLARAPRAGNYFLQHVDRGRYQGATIYRVGAFGGEAAPQLVQGGILQSLLAHSGPVNLAELGVETLPDFETTTQSGLQHDYAAVSLARDLLQTGNVIPEFVIYLRRTPQADENGSSRPDGRGYPVIGRVVAGMDIVQATTLLERDGATPIKFLQGQILTAPVRIDRVERIPCTAASRHAGDVAGSVPD